MRQHLCITFLSLLCSHALLGASGDWPQWRGPDRKGISKETGLLKEWPEAGPTLVWKATGLGGGHSTVAVVGDRIYTSGEKEATSYVVALNRADGKQAWTAKLGKSGAPGWGGFSGPRATPTIDGDLLFCVSQWGEMVCLSTRDGAEQWKKEYTRDFEATRPEWGWSESPLVDGDNVIITPGGPKGAVVALSKKSGAVAWRSTDFTDPAQYSSLIPVEIGGVRQYIYLSAENVVGIAAKDGKLLWKAPRKGSTAVIPDPVYHDGYVYVSSGYGSGCNLFKITVVNGAFSAEQVYANKTMINHIGGLIYADGAVYGYSDGKGWTCQDFLTGEARWQEKAKLGKGSVVCADGMLYLRQEDKKGTVALIEVSKEGYKQHGQFDQPDRSDKNSWAYPVIAGGKLYIRDQDVLLCYDVKAK